MPNECKNTVTITCDDEHELNALFENEVKNIYKVDMEKHCKNGIVFLYVTKYEADYKWLESLINKYKNVWVKNEWIEEGGNAGIWVGSGVNGVQSMAWKDLSIEAKYYIFVKNE
jgi:hypothetical protein